MGIVGKQTDLLVEKGALKKKNYKPELGLLALGRCRGLGGTFSLPFWEGLGFKGLGFRV